MARGAAGGPAGARGRGPGLAHTRAAGRGGTAVRLRDADVSLAPDVATAGHARRGAVLAAASRVGGAGSVHGGTTAGARAAGSTAGGTARAAAGRAVSRSAP